MRGGLGDLGSLVAKTCGSPSTRLYLKKPERGPVLLHRGWEKAGRQKTRTGFRSRGLGESTVHGNVSCIQIQREVNKAMLAGVVEANAKGYMWLM